MASNNWVKLTGLMGASAVALGAYGAHGLRAQSESMKEVWKTASMYHLIHTVALGISAVGLSGKKRNVVCTLLATGTLLFSGSCYTVALMDQRKPYSYPAPVGGTLLIAGWLAFGFM